VALRRRYLDIYRKTSFLNKVFEDQANCARENVKNKVSNIQLFADPTSRYAAPGRSSRTNPSSPTILQREGLEGQPQLFGQKSLEQDSFYTRSDDKTAAESPFDDQLHVKQENAHNAPLRDRTIVPETTTPRQSVCRQGGSPKLYEPATRRNHDRGRQLQHQAEVQIHSQAASQPSALKGVAGQDREVVYTTLKDTIPVLSPLPQVAIPKITANLQSGDYRGVETRINQDVFYSPRLDPATNPVLELEPVSEKPFSGLFHSPRIAKLVASKRTTGDLKLADPEDLSPQRNKLAQAVDSDSINHETAVHGHPEVVKTTDLEQPKRDVNESRSDIRKLATDIAEGDSQQTSSGSFVSPEFDHVRLDTDQLTAIR
jgi:hypothetical protein